MELPKTMRYEGAEFSLQKTKTRGPATYAIWKRESPSETSFAASKVVEGNEGKPEESILARIKTYPSAQEGGLYIRQVKNLAGTPEGARLLSMLYGHLEEHAKAKGVTELSASSLPHVFGFFTRKGFKPVESISVKRIALFKEKYKRFVREGLAQIEARNEARASGYGDAIPLHKKL